MFPNKNLNIKTKINQYIPRVKRLGREFLWIGIGNVAAAIGGLFGVKMMTSVLSPIAYGELALAMTGVILVQQIIMGPLSGAATRFYIPAKEKKEVLSFFTGTKRIIQYSVLIIVGLTALLVSYLWIIGRNEFISLVIGASILSLLIGVNGVGNGVQNAARHRGVVAWHQGIGLWFRFLFALGLISIAGSSSTIVIQGYIIGSGILLFSQIIFYRQNFFKDIVSQTINDEQIRYWIKKIIKYSTPFMVWGIFTWAQISSDRWALQLFSGPRLVGLYSVLYQIGYYPITLISSLFAQFATPILFAKAGDGNDLDRVNISYKLNGWLVGGVLFITITFAGLALFYNKDIFSLIAAPEYIEVSDLLPWMILAGGLFSAGEMAAIVFLSDFKTQDLIGPKIITALLGVILSFMGAYWFQLPGVIWSKVSVSLIYFLWVLFYLWKRLSVDKK